jgi:hypothetical protein
MRSNIRIEQPQSAPPGATPIAELTELGIAPASMERTTP